MRHSTFACRIGRRSRRGLTLMELVVVMVILVALAGVLLPMFPSMLTRAHTSTTATNIAEANKAIQLYYNLYSAYPNNLDNLVPSGGTSIVPYVAASANASDLSAYSLQAADVAALNNAGITSVLGVVTQPSPAAAWNPTFNPYSNAAITGLPTTPTTLATGTSVVGVSQQAVTRELGLTGYPTTATTSGTTTTTYANGTYVLFGLGDYSSAAGKTLEEAPVHFDDGAGGSPAVIYGRFGLVFQTADGSGTPLVAAKFVGVVDLADAGGITDASDHIQTYFNLK